jgi:hypothetical protein
MLMDYIFREMQTLVEVLGMTAMEDGSMTMILQRATKISLTGLKKRRDQGIEKVNPQDQTCTGTEILGQDMVIETQKIGTGTGTRDPLIDQEVRGREATTDIEKKDQRASGLGRTEILVAVMKGGVMKRQNGMGNHGDRTRFCQGKR